MLYTPRLASTCGRSQPFPRRIARQAFPSAVCPHMLGAFAYGGTSMRRFVRCSMLLTILTASGIGPAHAQTAGTTGPDRGYAELTVAATLGHKSDSSIGAEAGYSLTNALQLFLEGGGMRNVATTDVDARAMIIGNAIGASVSTAQRAAYFDIGAKYRLS